MSNKMNNYRKAGIAALFVCVFAACSKEKGTQVQEKVIPVKVMEIVETQTAIERNYVGTAEESAAISLSFLNAGTVEQVFVHEGQRVGKGQLLATLDAATARNAYEVSQAKLAQAQDAYERLARVHASGSLPDIKFVEIETGLQQAKSMAAVSKKALDDCKMYAPRSGVIASRYLEAGESAGPGIPAFKLVSADRALVKIPVPENEIGGVGIGQAARVCVPALDNAVFTGKVEIKGVIANALSHTYETKIGIDNDAQAGGVLLPGMVCKVSLAGDSGAAAFVAPNHAIRISPDGKCFVWMAEDGIARRRFVKTGGLASDGIVVTEGLTAGDRIIVEGFQKVSEGMKISITD